MTDSSFATRVVSLAGFSEEEKAVAMAKCSRSSNTFMEDALETRAKGNADKFNETVVVAYGHNSVADMSIGSLCFEDVSTLLAEEILGIPTGKYQGKSSRYVPFSRDRMVQPFVALLAGDASIKWRFKMNVAHTRYNKTINKLFDAYENLQPRVRAWVEAQPGWAPGEAKESAITARVFDALRYLLPLGALTNLGTRFSGRDTAELIRRLLVSPLAEAQDLAAKIKAVSDNETPTLVRHAVHKPIYEAVGNVFGAVPDEYFVSYKDSFEGKGVYLLDIWGSPWDVVKRQALIEKGRDLQLHRWSAQEAELYDALSAFMVSRKTRHDPIPQGYRAVRYKFVVAADFGTWKDLRRHRRNENPHAPFTAEHGYVVSDDVQAIGGDVLAEYVEAADAATAAFKELTELGFPAEAQYIITHGAIQRWEMDMDAEQLLYIAELRTEPFGHISYRRIARQMFDLAREVHPELYKHHFVHDVDGVGIHN